MFKIFSPIVSRRELGSGDYLFQHFDIDPSGKITRDSIYQGRYGKVSDEFGMNKIIKIPVSSTTKLKEISPEFIIAEMLKSENVVPLKRAG